MDGGGDGKSAFMKAIPILIKLEATQIFHKNKAYAVKLDLL
jgi:hypothetical protein